MFVMQLLSRTRQKESKKDEIQGLENLAPPTFMPAIGQNSWYIGENFYHGLKSSEDDNTIFHIKGIGTSGSPSTYYDSHSSFRQIVSKVGIFAMQIDLGKKVSELRVGDKLLIAGTEWEVLQTKMSGKFLELGYRGQSVILADNKRLNLAEPGNQLLKDWYMSIANSSTQNSLGLDVSSTGDSIFIYNYEMFEGSRFLGGESINVPFFGAHVTYDGLIDNKKLNVLFGDTGIVEIITSSDGKTRGETIEGHMLSVFCDEARLNIADGVSVKHAYVDLDKNKIFAKRAGDSYYTQYSLGDINLIDAQGDLQKIKISIDGIEVHEISRKNKETGSNVEDYTDISSIPIYLEGGEYRFKQTDTQIGYVYNQATHFEDLSAYETPMATTRGSVWNSVGTTAASLSFCDKIAMAQFSLEIDGVTSVSEQARSYAVFNNAVLFPNPVQNMATLRVDLQTNENVTIRVYNNIGQEVLPTQNLSGMGEKEIRFDTSSLVSGAYYLNMHDNSGNQMTMPFVVQK